jgi:NTE family protein
VGANELQCDLVLDAPWVLGIVPLVGAVWEIAQEGYTVARCAGVSAGAVVAALVAAGAPAMRSLDAINEFHEGFWNKPGSEYLRSGALKEFLSHELRRVGVRTFGDLKMSDSADSRPPGERYRLVIYVMNGRTVMRLPFDYTLLGLDPDTQDITQAVLASGSGTAFQAVHFAASRNSGGHHVKIADAFADVVVPADCFDRIDGLPPRWPTIAVAVQPAITGILPTSSPADVARTIMIHSDRTPLLDADATAGQLFDFGAKAAKIYLSPAAAQSAMSGAAAQELIPATEPGALSAPPVQPGHPLGNVQDMELFLKALREAATYVAKGGAPLILGNCLSFGLEFLKACRKQTGGHLPHSRDQTSAESAAALGTLFAVPGCP